jgi:hypothetical protein
MSSLHLLSRSVFACLVSSRITKTTSHTNSVDKKIHGSPLAVWIFPCLSARPRIPIDSSWNTTSRPPGTHGNVTPSVIHGHKVPVPFFSKKTRGLVDYPCPVLFSGPTLTETHTPTLWAHTIYQTHTPATPSTTYPRKSSFTPSAVRSPTEPYGSYSPSFQPKRPVFSPPTTPP